MTNRVSRIIFTIILATVSASPALGQEDVRGVKLRSEAPRVIEEKCLVCHNQKRIDTAVKERRKMEQILKMMEKQGVVLTEKERRVMGHFWGQKMYKESKPQK
jgi:hypothetical protein